MFIFGFIVGAAVATVVFIIFYKHNQKTLEAARSGLIDIYNKADDALKAELEKIGVIKK